MALSRTQPDYSYRDKLMQSKLVIMLTGILSTLISCGIEEYYYLPQVSENNIIRSFNTHAEINFPPIPSEYYYAANYKIFYKIYISDFNTEADITPDLMPGINPTLASDYRMFEPITDPTNTTSITSINTFRNNKYYELQLEGEDINNILSKAGGSLSISFSPVTGFIPTVSFGGQTYNLLRSSSLISPEPRNNLYFQNTQELRNYSFAADINKNADVAGRAGTSQLAYVSMYIVASGTNPVNFTGIYSKPTHISVFKLPD